MFTIHYTEMTLPAVAFFPKTPCFFKCLRFLAIQSSSSASLDSLIGVGNILEVNCILTFPVNQYCYYIEVLELKDRDNFVFEVFIMKLTCAR
jgi:hypothetical protein